MATLDRLFNKRLLVVVLCTVFLISLASLLSSIFPMETGNWSLDSFREGELASDDTLSSPPPIASSGAKAAPAPASQEQTESEPDVAADDLVEVKTAPTKAEDWKPKHFDPPSSDVMKAIEDNLLIYKKDKILLTAVANAGMGDYTLNWIESLKRTDLDSKFLVFAIDDGMVDLMKQHGYGDHVIKIPDDWFHQKLDSGFSKWLDKSYTPITHGKTLVVERLLYLDVTVWFSDVDIVFTSKGIYEYLTEKLTARGTKTQLLISQETEQKILNSGFYIMRPTTMNKRILADTIMIQDNEPEVTQQRAMNRVVDELDLSYQTSNIALLDLFLFPHGRMYFERNTPTKYGVEPMMVHANWRVGDKKKESLQKAGLWYIE